MKRLYTLYKEPYLELTLVLWLKRLRRERYKLIKGIRHIGPLASVEGVSMNVFDM
jgi:hypothetical protein